MRVQIRKMKVIIGGKFIGMNKSQAQPGAQRKDKPFSLAKVAEQDGQTSAAE